MMVPWQSRLRNNVPVKSAGNSRAAKSAHSRQSGNPELKAAPHDASVVDAPRGGTSGRCVLPEHHANWDTISHTPAYSGPLTQEPAADLILRLPQPFGGTHENPCAEGLLIGRNVLRLRRCRHLHRARIYL